METMTFSECWRAAHGIASKGRNLASDLRDLIEYGSTPPSPYAEIKIWSGESLIGVEYPANWTRVYRALRAHGFGVSRAREFMQHAKESSARFSVTYNHTTPTPGRNYHLWIGGS